MLIEFSHFVEQDLDEIAAFIAQDNPVRAVSFILEIRQRLQQISDTPQLYRLRPEIGSQARLALYERYVILFCIINNGVRIERIAYGGRDLEALYEPPTQDSD